MMRMAMAAALLAGCVPATTDNGVNSSGGAGEGAAQVDSISYERGPCFGFCPVYRVTVRADGTGTFEGRSHTAVTGTRTFSVTEDQYRAFADHLAPLRPASGSVRLADPRECDPYATDHPSAEVTWEGSGERQSYYLYFGCAMPRNRPARQRLEAAPALLPIAEFIGRQ